MSVSSIRAAVLAAAVLAVGLGAGAAPAGASAPAGADDKAKEFTACMRSHGLPDFPEVTILTGGRVSLALGSAPFDPFDRTYREAVKACGSLLPAGLPAAPEPPDLGELTLPVF